MSARRKRKSKSLNMQILIGAMVGVVGGLILGKKVLSQGMTDGILFVAQIVGNVIFMGLLKMILIPLVFTSIVVGIGNLRAHHQMSRVWKLTLVYFFSTLALAVFLGLIIVNIFHPGQGIQVEYLTEVMARSELSLESLSGSEWALSFLGKFFINPIQAMADGQIIAVVVFAIFLGIGLIAAGEKTRGLQKGFNELFHIMMMIIGWIMRLTPYGVGALLLRLFATQDMQLLVTLGKFIAVVLLATLFHGFVSLPIVLRVVSRYSPLRFFAGIKEALITAFSTSSSAATLPITMTCVTDQLDVDENVAGFVLPLGATVNMDGTALYEAVAAIFIANIVGIELGIIEQCTVFLMSIVAAIGAPGIPSAGMVTMMMVLRSVGLPEEAVALLLPIDRLLDAVRTMVNVEGDAVGAVIVNSLVHPQESE